jgi:formylglycine-generating enzyme required for sulfatase activity
MILPGVIFAKVILFIAQTLVGNYLFFINQISGYVDCPCVPVKKDSTGKKGNCMMMSKAIIALTAVATIGMSQIRIDGVVKDSTTGAPLPQAVIYLEKKKLLDTTDSDGKFAISDGSGISTNPQIGGNLFSLKIGPGNRLEMQSATTQRVHVSIVDIRGKSVATALDRVIGPGVFCVVPPGFSAGYYLYSVTASGKRFCKPFIVTQTAPGDRGISRNSSEFLQFQNGSITAESGFRSSLGTGVFTDTLSVSPRGYLSRRIAIREQVVSNLSIECKQHSVISGLVKISAQGKSFLMGVAGTIPAIPHQVTFTYNYLIDSTEIIQDEYTKVMGVNPSLFSGSSSSPVEYVTWFDAALFCNERSKRAGLDTVYSYSKVTGTPGNGCTLLSLLVCNLAKSGFRLPTEAEWEYACRAGTATKFYWGDAQDSATIAEHAWFFLNSGQTTHPVATKGANDFFLSDMSGNVGEWCNDWFLDYAGVAEVDPIGPAVGASRICRGGAYNFHAPGLGSGDRQRYNPDGRGNNTGFRCALLTR